MLRRLRLGFVGRRILDEEVARLDIAYAPYPPMPRSESIYRRAMYEFCMVANTRFKMRLGQWVHIDEEVLPHVVGYVIGDVIIEIRKMGSPYDALTDDLERKYGL